MASVISQQEVDALRAPFPLDAHSIREGNRTKDGKKIQWFVYVEKTAVEDRLNEVFPGEWGSSQPVLTPIGNGVAATISITIRGISRGNTGEDTNGTEKAKGATTDAFRRAAADWGVAKYLWEMELKIWTESYPDKDYAASDARKNEAFNKFAAWYKNKFQNISKLPAQTHQEAPISIAAGQNVPMPQNAQNSVETAKSRFAGNGAPPAGEKKRIGNSDETREWTATAVTVRKSNAGKPYLQYTCNEGKPTSYGRDMLRSAGYECEDWTQENETYQLTPPAKVTVQKKGNFWNVTALAVDLSKVDFQ